MATVLERPSFTETFREGAPYTIKSGIPIPPKAGGRRPERKYPFAALRVGDCFDVLVSSETRKGRPATASHVQSRVALAFRQYAKRHDHRAKVTTRSLNDGAIVRIWRIA